MNVRHSLTRYFVSFAALLSPLVAAAQMRPVQRDMAAGAYIVSEVNGSVSCRDANRAEAERLNAPHNVPTRVLGRAGGIRTNSGGGLDIVLRGTAQLDGNPEAKAAFERAAEIWESKINTPVTIEVEVDFGPMLFGDPFDEDTIAAASTPSYLYDPGEYPSLRARLIGRANNSAELAILNLLPLTAIPSDAPAGDLTQVGAGGPLLRGIGEFDPLPIEDDPRPRIGFNSAFEYDFDPSNGISPFRKDFEGVVVHEIGHMLGFASRVGAGEIAGATVAPSVLDLFRFRPGVTSASFQTAQRVLSTGGEQIFFAGGNSLGFSTGNPRGENGDQRQASHWKDDAITGTRIGIMDPTLSNATRSEITANDLAAFGMIGWEIDGESGCSELEPNETAANASELAFGTPCNGNAAEGDTSSYQISYNDGTIIDGIEDIFKLTLTSSAKISATMTFATTSADLDIMLFTVSGTTLGIVPGGISNGADSTETFTTDNVLSPGTYYLGVSAYEGSSSYTISATTTGGLTAPAAPTSLTATTAGNTQINLSWVDRSNNETEFRIERETAPGTFTDIGSVAANTTTFVVTGLTPGTTSRFRVRARNTAGDSAYSNIASATTTVPPAPCVANATTVCLLNNRFKVVIDYVNPFSNPPNQPGTFLAARLNSTPGLNPDVALFGFASAQAVEVVVRIQDTRPFAPRFDVYYGGMTDVGYVVTVTDTQTGVVRQYVNQVGQVGGGVDRNSFPAN